MVAAVASAPVQDQEAQQASAQELQSLRDSLGQSEAKTRELECQLETLNKVSLLFSACSVINCKLNIVCAFCFDFLPCVISNS